MLKQVKDGIDIAYAIYQGYFFYLTCVCKRNCLKKICGDEWSVKRSEMEAIFLDLKRVFKTVETRILQGHMDLREMCTNGLRVR